METNDRNRDRQDLHSYNRKLLAAMKQRDLRARMLDQAQQELDDARRKVRALIDRLGQPAPPPAPLCPDCGYPHGSNPACLDCQARTLARQVAEHARPENP